MSTLFFLGLVFVIINYAPLRPRFIQIPFLSQQQPKITLIFRYDDYSATSDSGVEKKFVQILQKFQMPCTFGVIPFVCQGSSHDLSPQPQLPLSREKVELIQEAVKAGLIEVALHGFSHQTVGKPSWFGYSEFLGLSLPDQLKKIKAGKEYLEKVFACGIVTFIPPWNSYDQGTLIALEKLRFLCLSARLRGSGNRATSLMLLPSTCELAQLKDTILLARESKTKGPLICVTLHEYDFQECSYQNGTARESMSLTEFEGLLAWIARQEDVAVINFQKLFAPEIPTRNANPVPAEDIVSYSLVRLSHSFMH